MKLTSSEEDSAGERNERCSLSEEILFHLFEATRFNTMAFQYILVGNVVFQNVFFIVSLP